MMEAWKTALAYTFAVTPEVIQILVHYTEIANRTLIPTVGPAISAPLVPATTLAPDNTITGEAACENLNLDQGQCLSVGCCLWQAGDVLGSPGTMSCHSGVGPAACFKAATPVVVIPPSTPAPAAVVAATAAPTAAPLVAATVAPTVTSGPVIEPLIPGRRLEEEQRVEKIEVKFTNGLHYELDNLLVDQMIKEGLFRQLEEVPSADDKALAIHSYSLKNNKWPEELSEKDSLPDRLANGLLQSQGSFSLAALSACALLGVAFVVRRVRASYSRDEENMGPVE